MLRPIRCTRCGNHATATTAELLARRILCATCGQEMPLSSSAPVLDRQGMMRMGDDEGGGDWGGGGDDSAEDEEEEEEGEDGKKKKKKKKGFFAGLMGKLISAVIGAVVLGALCCCAVVVAFFFPSHPLVGEWEKIDSVMVKVKVPDETDKDKEVEKEEARETAHLLNIVKGDDKSGTGTYTFTGADEKENKTVAFKWKDWDKEKKTVVFEANSPDDKFWKDIKSPATFNVNAAGNNLELTSGAEKMTFTKVAPPPKEDKGGGGKKGGGKRR